ncbi:hypothetical protein TSACC_375 [Terrimicrobium sacchariphilum]|jgi:predicted RNA-binding protein YlqC (UPF0109 family)|uniref:RNA-binding protein KhpA n=1 Tax=Terrimicrobium sacchariphilum TaxID=690879 RepID=A0A146GBN6_TERSA|nr:KH domain-containing protein [Terrimicrobium sacchariphilum]GAT35015.1 hypothetical protein TSACC_375 [Terrimicrobium sacchariphilum]
MEEFLRFVIGNLVEAPEAIVLTKTEAEDRVVYHLALRKTDVPKIIGKGGHTIQAIRTLLSAAGHKRGVKATLEIVE